jgi:hypothetical protein
LGGRNGYNADDLMLLQSTQSSALNGLHDTNILTGLAWYGQMSVLSNAVLVYGLSGHFYGPQNSFNKAM